MKKGAYDIGRKAVYMFIVVFFLAVIFLNANSIFSQFQQRITKNTDGIDNKLILLEMITSKNCLALEDAELKRVYQGIIDIKKFDTTNLRQACARFAEKKFFIQIGDKRIGDIWDGPQIITETMQVVIKKEDGTIEKGTLELGVERV